MYTFVSVSTTCTIMYNNLIVENRTVGKTSMNEWSSRSHSIFTLSVESRLRDEEGGDGTVKVASLVSQLIVVIQHIQDFA